MCVLVAQLCPTLCDPMDCSPPGSSVYEIFQARILEWVPLPSPGNLSNAGIKPGSPALQEDSFTTRANSEAQGKYYAPIKIENKQGVLSPSLNVS